MESGSLSTLIAQAFLVLVPMILSLTVHEYAHGLAAKLLGDDTAERAGRLNLNPLSHIDPMGTILLPMLTLVASGAMGGGGHIPFFGWAKPVPFDSGRFTRKLRVRTGLMLVAAAGPLSNLIMAFICAGIISVAQHTGTLDAISPPMAMLLQQMMWTNIGLFVFNMIPVYPLDGQKVVAGLLSSANALRFDQFNHQFGTMLLLGVIFFAREIITYPVILVSRGLLAAVGLG